MDVSGPLLLLETDGVPGAILSPINPHRWSMDQLKQWLRCRGLAVGGKKPDLIERFLKRSANKKLCHILDPGFENGKWLELKRQKLLSAANVTFPQKPILPVTGWMSFPSNDIPAMFNEGHIIHYIVESTPAVLPSFIPRPDDEDEEEDDDEDCEPKEGSIQAFRRGKRFVKSKFVLNVKDRCDQNYYYLKGEVRASMNLEIRNVTATLSAGSGAVLDATCTCKARVLGRCAHISALLLYANKRVVEYGHEGAACTSKTREWGRGTVQRDPGRLIEKDYYSRDFTRRSTFDPRPTAHQNNEPHSQDALHHINFLIQGTGVESVFLKHILISYEDGDFAQEILASLDIQVRQFYYYLEKTIAANSDPYLIPNTTDQAKSTTWMLIKSFLATASNAHRILHLASDKAKMNFLQEKLWSLRTFTTNGMKYGIKNESTARETYVSWRHETDITVSVKETGLWVKKGFSYLGCSPDGIIHAEGKPDKLLEIKCLKVLEKCHPKNFQNYLNKRQLSRFPLTKNTNGTLRLKETHPHYYQVQMALEILGMQECDYFIWSPKGHITASVPYDPLFWEPKLVELSNIHGTLIIPEFFLQRTPRRLPPITFKYDEEEEDL